MQRQEPTLLPGESAPVFIRRSGAVTAGRGGDKSRIIRAPPVAPPVAPPTAPPMTQSALPIALGEQAGPTLQDYRAGRSLVNIDDYFLGVLGQCPLDSSVMGPLGPEEKQSASPAREIAPTNAIFDTRAFIDTLAQPSAFNGFPNGIIPFQFADLGGASPPDNVIEIALSPFNFPRANVPGSAFGALYFKTVYATVQCVPATLQTQTIAPNSPFTFELRVSQSDADYDPTMVYLMPSEPTFSLKQPITTTGDLTIRFQTRSPAGGFIPYPIPPTRVHVMRKTAMGNITTMTMSKGESVSAIAPIGATYSVPILFLNYNTGTAITPLEAQLVNAAGYHASNFVSNGSTESFDIDADTTNAGGSDIYAFVPKNGVALKIRFTSISTTKTNGLLPVRL